MPLKDTSLWVRWSPRVLAILYALFLSLFAFDSWEGAATFWEGLAGFLIHLMPVYVVAAALAAGWRWPRAGGVLFLALAAGFALVFNWSEPLTLLLMAGPPALAGVLFLLGGRVAAQPHFGG